MSFSSEVKRELAGVYGRGRHCHIAELAGIINTCGSISSARGLITLKMQTENPAVAKKFFTLVKKCFNTSSEISIRNSKKFKKARLYCCYVNNPAIAEKILNATGLHDPEAPTPYAKRLNHLVVKNDCCRYAYIRGAFMSGGSISDPEKGYHLEFVNTDETLSQGLADIINKLELHAKIIRRKAYHVVYLKEGENIVDIINAMGAHNSLMALENLRIIKDMRNNVNRIVNCETANLTKVVTASVTQIQDIEYIQQTKGFEYLSEQLEAVARARLSNPDASLKEIGELLTPPVGKSGVNHRLRKINEIAENLRSGF